MDNAQANKAIADTAKNATKGSQETQEAFQKIGAVAGRIATGIGIAAMALGTAWVAAIEGTREYRTEMGKLDTAFQIAGHSSEAAKKTYSDLHAVLGDTAQAVEASQQLALLTDNEKELSTWTDICTGVYARMGDAVPIEELAASSNETARSGILTGGLVDALVLAGHNEEAFQEKLDACTTEQQRQDLIMNTLKGTYSKASEQYKKTNKDVMDAQKAQERLTGAMAKLGEVGEPILTAIKNKVAEMAEKAIPHLENFIQKVKDVAAWVKDNGDTIDTWVGVIAGAGTAIGTFLLILNWGTIMTSAANALKVVRTAILGMNAALLANPIALVVALLAGLVVGFLYLWNNVEGFRKFWLKAWAYIQSAASTAKKAITNLFSNIGSWFRDKFAQIQRAGQDAMSKTRKWFSDAYRNIKNVFTGIPGWFRSKFQSAWTSIKGVFSGWASFFGSLWSKIKSKFSSIGSSLGKAMGNAVKSGMNRVISSIQNSINKGINLINSAISLANKLPGIKVGKVGKVSLPRLYQGGVLEKGQVGLLEGTGAEAVVPLERNTAWLSRVAQDLNRLQKEAPPAQGMGQGTEQVLAMLSEIVRLLTMQSTLTVSLDSGVLVGELTPAIDARLSDRLMHSRRGNTR